MPKTGINTSKEKSIISVLKEIVPEFKAQFLFWKYAPVLLPKPLESFEDFKNHFKMFPSGITEQQAMRYLLEENVQAALKLLLARLHQQRMAELYLLYYEKAKNDTAAFREFCNFSKEFFKENKQSELTALLNDIQLDDHEEELN